MSGTTCCEGRVPRAPGVLGNEAAGLAVGDLGAEVEEAVVEGAFADEVVAGETAVGGAAVAGETAVEEACCPPCSPPEGEMACRGSGVCGGTAMRRRGGT